MNQVVQDSSTAHVAVLDWEGNIVATNEAWNHFAHKNIGEERHLWRTGVGVNYLDICRAASGPFAEEAPAVHDGILAVLRGELNHFTLEYPCPVLGESRWFLMSVTPLLSAEGGAVISHLDITERKCAESLLAEERERLAHVIATAPGVVCSFRLRPDGRMSYPLVNPRIEEIYGLPPEAIAVDASPIFTLMPPEDALRVSATVAESARTLSPWHAEFRVFHPKRGEIWVEGDSKPMREADGSTLWQGILTDVTARKQAESRLRYVLTNARCLLWSGRVIAFEDGVVRWETDVADLPAAQAFCPLELALGETYTQAAHRLRLPEDQQTTIQTALQALHAGLPEYVVEFRQWDAAGTVRWFSERVSIEERPVRPAMTDPTCRVREWWVVGVCTEITDQKQAEEQQQSLTDYLRQVTEQANCLLWRAEVFEIPTVPDWSVLLDPDRGTGVFWKTFPAINEDEVLNWLPIARKENETFSESWYYARHKGDLEECNKRSARALVSGTDRYTQLFRTFVRDGSVRWLQEDVRVLPMEPTDEQQTWGENLRHWGVTGVVTDVTERIAVEEALRVSEERLAFALEATGEGVWDWNIITDTLRMSPAGLDMIGYTLEEFSGTLAFFVSRCHPVDRIELERLMRNAVSGQTRNLSLEVRYQHKNGHYTWVLIRGKVVEWNPQGAPVRMVGTNLDITQRKAMEEALWWRAHHDSLTGLPNREWIRTRIDEDLKQKSLAADSVSVGALLLMDLDGFKYVNDSLGHDAGDRVLQVVAARLGAALETDLIGHNERVALARLGGDEFVIWIPHLRPERVTTSRPGRHRESSKNRDTTKSQNSTLRAYGQIAESILRTLSQPTRVDSASEGKREFLMTASIGIALCPDDGTEMETLLKSADIALYQAKEAGRSKYRFYTQERSLAVSQRLTMETRLRRAVKGQKMTLAFQPQVDVVTQQVVGVEALVRWTDEKLGSVPPSVFIPLAEEIGLIHALGEFVLREACQQVASWRQVLHPTLRICVNLSALQLVEEGMVRIVLSALERSNLPGNALELEITETALFRSGEQGVAHFLSEVRNRGIRLAVDDFGTGYSSLSHLRSVPVDVVKIDKGFIQEMGENRQTCAIVKAIIDLAHALGLTVTAEGVETEKQQITLTTLNCDTVQGYLFSRPLPAQGIEELLRSRATLEMAA
jgi:diguanylate cyclase (GGDEF)-like protein/PAS domain S-box-containing protein